MLRTQTGSIDGYRIDTYQTGSEYDMGKTEKHTELARVFLREGWAEHVDIKVDHKDATTTRLAARRAKRK